MTLATRQLLEQHFDTAFAAPDGIAKLRELILTLAMLGKLVEQDPHDPPASELLKEIEAEKLRLVKSGKIKKPKPLPPIKPEEAPYELPTGWEWVRLGEITGYNGRKNISGDEIGPNTWLLDLEDIEKGTSRILNRAKFSERQSKSTKSTFQKGDVLYGKLRPYLDKVVVADTNGVCTTEIVPIVPFNGIHSEFLRWLLKRPAFLAHVNSLMYGVKMPRLGTEDAVISIHPLPPLSEQHRIVARIDQLMVRCDELEKLRKARETRRLAVHTAVIKQLLDAPDGSAWDFIQQHFGELYTAKENVAELRKAILQLAVMGRLLPQDPNDPPASELLKEIEAEKKLLVEAGKIKQPKLLPPIKLEEMPYELPKGWEWVRFFDTNTVKSELVSARDFQDENQIAPDSIEKGTGSLLFHRTVAESGATGPNNRFYEGQILYSKIRPSLNKVVVAPYDGLCSADMYPIICHTNTQFMLKVILSEPFLVQVRLAENRVKMPKLNLESLGQFVAPLPPLPEQLRIVAKIDKLMTLCDTLEQQINIATVKQSELLSALLTAQPQQHTDIIDLSTYRSAIGCYVVGKLANTQYFGRTAAAKVMYLAQAHVGLTLDFHPERQAAGPLDKWIYDFERQGKRQGWFEVNEKTLASGKKKADYRCLSALSEPAAKAEALMSVEQQAEFDRLIYALADKKTEDVEVIATLFAVWNDFLIDGIQPTDEQIIAEVRENWHERKARFSPAELGRWLDWLRSKKLVPQGRPPRTVQQPRLRFDWLLITS